MKQKPFILLLLFLLSLPAIFSLFHPGFFQSDDGEWMIIRFSAFHQAFRDGEFPVRWLGRLNHGYGYPVANFLYPGFMYLSELPKVLGFGFVDSIKIILGFSIISSAVFTYLWLSKLFGKTSALMGALFYLYTPYHLFDLYKRGSVGEVLALAAIPFILWALERKSLVFSSFGIGFLILSHNTLALLFLPIVFLYGLVRKVSTIYHLLFTIFLGFGLSAFFWIPAVFELCHVRFSQVSVSDFKQYFAPIELIGISPIILLSFAAIFTVEPLNKANKGNNRVQPSFILMAVLSLFSIIFSSKVSFFLWNFIPSSFVQFPFRLLSYLHLSLAFLSAFVIYQLRGKKQIIVSLILLLSLAFSTFPYLKPSEFFNKGEGFYATNEGTTTVQDEYLPRWVKDKPTKHFDQKIEIIEGKGSISSLIYNSKKVQFNMASEDGVDIRINTIYYPGWKAFIDGRESTVQYNNDFGVMDLSIPKGNHNIELNFSETPLRLFADILSVLSFAGLIMFVKIYKYKKHE